jgi:hypothetical protein
MKALRAIKLWLIVAVVAALVLVAGPVLAHERREVGQYHFVVGFMVEPAYEGQKNGVSLTVSRESEPVEGLEEPLQVEITHVPTGASKTMELRSIFNDPGHYTADLIPTAPGQYRFRFFGAIEGMEVDETFQSGPDTFGDVESSGELQFPEALPAVREIEGAVRGAQATAQEAQDAAVRADDRAGSASVLAIVGIALGAVGIVSGIGGAFLSMRRR